MMDTVYQDQPSSFFRMLGARFKDGPHAYRMNWGELSFKRGWAAELHMFEEHFSLHIHVFWVSLYITLPFLQKWHKEPEEMMESWGISRFDNSIHLHWGPVTKVYWIPWRTWTQVSHDVRQSDGSWAPYVGSWEGEDGRHIEEFPYRYLLRSGEVQNVSAQVYVERRRHKLNCFRWLPFAKTSHDISIEFSDEVGERAGSWKGGCIGCGYELRPDETPFECLKRMERERTFK